MLPSVQKNYQEAAKAHIGCEIQELLMAYTSP